MKLIKLPGPMRIIWGSLGCYWLKDIINPGFLAIAIMLLLFIPVLIMETSDSVLTKKIRAKVTL